MKTTKLIFPLWQGCGDASRCFKACLSLGETLFGLGYGRLVSSSYTKVAVPEEKQLSLEHGILGRTALVNGLENARLLLEDEKPEKIVMVGATCAAELAPISYLNELYAGDLAIVWLDAHGDLNTPSSSPSGHFHGMVLRALLGEGDEALLPKRPLAPGQVFLVGTRDLDPAEAEFINQKRIPCFPPDLDAIGNQLVERIKASGFSRVYVHLDFDALDPGQFPYALVPTPKGLTKTQLLELMNAIAPSFTVVGASVVEFAAREDTSRAVAEALRLLADVPLYETDGGEW